MWAPKFPAAIKRKITLAQTLKPVLRIVEDAARLAILAMFAATAFALILSQPTITVRNAVAPTG
jgi:hypothetical protein